MRITDIEAFAIDIPLTRNFGGSTYSVLKRSTVVTRLTTTDGVRSEIYNGDNREHGPEIARIIRDELLPLVKGASIFATELLWEKMFALSVAGRDRKTLLEANACVDCAIWDVIGKTTKTSVRQLLGGYREQLPIISIGGYYRDGKTLADIGREMEMYRDAGMAGCKFKVGGLAPEQDAKRVEAARRAVGPDFLLMVDANRGWSAPDAIRFARLIEKYDIRWFEEPCHWHDDAALMARVRRATSIPITAGQSEITLAGVRRLIEATPWISSTTTLPRAAASPTGGARQPSARRTASTWRTMRKARSHSIFSPPCRTAPTSNASPIPSATPSGRPCGPTAPARKTAWSRFRPGTDSAWPWIGT